MKQAFPTKSVVGDTEMKINKHEVLLALTQLTLRSQKLHQRSVQSLYGTVILNTLVVTLQQGEIVG